MTSTVSLILSDRMAQYSKTKFKTNKKKVECNLMLSTTMDLKRVLTKGCFTQIFFFFYMIERVIYVYEWRKIPRNN